MQTEVMRSGDNGLNLPVNVKRLLENAQRKFGCRPHKRGATGACRQLCLGRVGVAAPAHAVIPPPSRTSPTQSNPQPICLPDPPFQTWTLWTLCGACRGCAPSCRWVEGAEGRGGAAAGLLQARRQAHACGSNHKGK